MNLSMRGGLLLAGLVVSWPMTNPHLAQAQTPEATPTTTSSPATEPIPTSADLELAQLVEQMSSETYRDREAAYAKLKAMGASVVPLLRPYATHPDPEVRSRIAAIINANRWMLRGALIISVEEGTQARKLGLRVGDVIVKVNDTPITSHLDFREMPSDTQRTYYFLRRDYVQPMKVAPGRLGVQLTNWNAEKGGVQQIRGLQAMGEGQYEQAEAYLSAAIAQGMDDPWTLGVAVAVMDHNLNHTSAMQVYEKLHDVKSNKNEPAYADVMAYPSLRPVAVASPIHRLLRQLQDEPLTGKLSSDIETVAMHYGRNFPLARDVAGRNAPLSPAYDFWVRQRVLIAMQDNRLTDALDIFRSGGADKAFTRQAHLAARILILMGKPNEAAELLDGLITQYTANGEGWVGFAIGEVFAAALASGDMTLAGSIYARMTALPVDRFDYIMCYCSMTNLDQQLQAPRLIKRLNEYVQAHPQAKWTARLLAHLYASVPSQEPVDFDAVVRIGRAAGEPRTAAHAQVIYFLRTGQYDQAEQAMASWPGDWDRPAALTSALTLLRQNAARLQGDWAMLQGVTYVFPGPDGGRFAMKSTGEVFLIDRDNQVHATTGLSNPAPLPSLYWGDGIVSHATGTLYLHRNQIYLYDAKNFCWQSSYAANGEAIRDYPALATPAGPVVVRYLLEHYPCDREGRHLTWADRTDTGWTLWGFWGDLVVATQDATGQVVDLSAELGKQLGRPGLLAVYRPKLAGQRFLVPTVAGLWAMDLTGKLTRLSLPLEQQEVMLSLLDLPKKAGTTHIGVAPQQGGQIVQYDDASGAMTLTGGYCGLGPDDCHQYAGGQRTMALGYALVRLAAQRLPVPATSPAETMPAEPRP